MRALAFVALTIVVVFFGLAGIVMPLTLASQAARDRSYYQEFEQVAAYAGRYVQQNGQLPDDALLRHLDLHAADPMISSLTTSPMACDPNFKKAANDRFVLSFWRGEWSECYAYPSGRTTLPMSIDSYLLSSLGIELIGCWLIALIAAWGAVRLFKRGLSSIVSA